jgi:hypothetical protein
MKYHLPLLVFCEPCHISNVQNVFHIGSTSWQSYLNISCKTQEQMAKQLPHVFSSGTLVMNKWQWNVRMFVRVAVTQFAEVRFHS